MNKYDLFQQISSLLGGIDYRIADERYFPRALAFQAADVLEVEIDDAMTAEQILAEVLTNFAQYKPHGNTLEARSSALVAILQDHFRDHNVKDTKRKASVFEDAESHGFHPAKNKLEAVNRISSLTKSGPETLGPGSKERKSVLENLARSIGTAVPADLSKIQLGNWIALQLGGDWNAQDYSAGYTITLRGLNKLLELGTHYFEAPGLSRSLEAEASAIVAGTVEALGLSGTEQFRARAFNGYDAVDEMFKANYRHRNQTEWFAWYAEFKVLPHLISRYKGGPKKIGQTWFDYHGTRTWDLKVHSVSGGADKTPLNDKESVRIAAANGGIGFIVVNAHPGYSGEDDFYNWHCQKRGKNTPEPRSPNSRRLKVTNKVTSVEAYFFPDLASIDEACQLGILSDFNQGRQQDGSPRKVKYNLHLKAARDSRFFITSLPQK